MADLWATILTWLDAHTASAGLGLTVLLAVLALGRDLLSASYAALLSALLRADTRPRLVLPDGRVRVSILNEYSAYFWPKWFRGERTLFLVHARLQNPSEHQVTFVDFELRYRTLRFWRRFSHALYPISFPSPIRQNIGDKIKYVPVFNTHFPQEENELGIPLTVGLTVAPNDANAGYFLFCDEVYGSWLAKRSQRGVAVQLSCRDLKGRPYKTDTYAYPMSREVVFEMSPGLESYVLPLWAVASEGRVNEPVDPEFLHDHPTAPRWQPRYRPPG